MAPISILARIAALVLLIFALRGRRWAYVALVAVCLLYFPARTGFRLHPQACELVPTMQLAVLSLQNTAHIIMFAAFYYLSWIQFRRGGRVAFVWAGVATLIAGTLLELAQGMTGHGHCRLRDLIPDSAGALVAALLLGLWDSRHRQAGQGAS